MRVMLDTNVVLDTMLQRKPWHPDADAIVQAAAQGFIVCAATTLTLATVYYVGRKTSGDTATRDAIRKYLSAFIVPSVNHQHLLDADNMLGRDFEDNIIIAAAVASNQDAIITRNGSDFVHSPIPVLTPAELLQRIQFPTLPPPTANGSP